MANEFQNADSRHILALNACVFECGILKSIDERRNMKKNSDYSHAPVETRSFGTDMNRPEDGYV
jgi:hypothetical protein